jgi:hypothetical protein
MYIKTVRILKKKKRYIYNRFFFLKNQSLIALIISIYVYDVINYVNYIIIHVYFLYTIHFKSYILIGTKI